jgi:hypothetical protein
LIESFPAAGRESPTAKRFCAAILVSLALHAAVLWELPAMPRMLPGEPDAGNVELNVRLIPRPSPPPQAAPAPAERPRAVARPAPQRERPAPRLPEPVVAEAPAVATAPSIRPAEPDLLAYVEARRRARSAPAEEFPDASRAPQDENERARRTATGNLASTREMVFGYDPSRSGGVFQVERLGYDYAEFTFVGWNGDARRYMKQLIEVRKGTHSDIRIAVVRKMIAVIRRYEPEEFTWDSQRLGRSLTLSSRPRDNAGLEDFMMQEFFSRQR